MDYLTIPVKFSIIFLLCYCLLIICIWEISKEIIKKMKGE